MGMLANANSVKNKKKILIVDDSALMRRVMCDIINSDERFQVVEQAFDGEAAYALLKKNQYDGVVLDVNMPKINGIQLLRILQKDKIRVRIMMASTDTREHEKAREPCQKKRSCCRRAKACRACVFYGRSQGASKRYSEAPGRACRTCSDCSAYAERIYAVACGTA